MDDNTKYQKSTIDDLFFGIFGFYPSKAGQAYEMLVSAVLKLVLNKDIEYNQFERGIYSETVYQLDGLIRGDNYPIEAKDYTLRDSKVGRPDLQKLEGALADLDAPTAAFASATDYSAPAKKYSNAPIPNHKPIELFHIRPSVAKDEEGRIKKIVFTLVIKTPSYIGASFNPIWTNEANQKLLDEGYENKELRMALRNIVDYSGETKWTVEELTEDFSKKGDADMTPIQGCWILNGGHLLVDEKLYEIKGLEFSIPYEEFKHEIVIESDGKPKVYIKSENGTIDKLITDRQLRSIKFENGKVNIVDQN